MPAKSITTDATLAAVLAIPTTTAVTSRVTKEALSPAMAVKPTAAIAKATMASTLDAINCIAASGCARRLA